VLKYLLREYINLEFAQAKGSMVAPNPKGKEARVALKVGSGRESRMSHLIASDT